MLERMKEIIAEQLNVNVEELKPETNFKEDLGTKDVIIPSSPCSMAFNMQ